MRGLQRSTIVLAGVALMISSMADQTRADRFNLGDGYLNCGRLPSPLKLTNVNLELTPTASNFASLANSSLGGASMIGSFKPVEASANERRATILLASYVGAAAAVPEPTTLLLMGTGLATIAALLRRRFKGRRQP